MNAAFRTEGYTMTHSALSSRSCGMSSGMSRISFNTVPQFCKRAASFLSMAANSGKVIIASASRGHSIRLIMLHLVDFLARCNLGLFQVLGAPADICDLDSIAMDGPN